MQLYQWVDQNSPPNNSPRHRWPWDIHPSIHPAAYPLMSSEGMHSFLRASPSAEALEPGGWRSRNSTVPTVYLELAGCVEPGKVVWGQGMLCDSPHFLLALSWLHSMPLMMFPQAQPKITNTF